MAAALTTGTTAVTDLWLQLLLRTIQAAGGVKQRLAARRAAAQEAGGAGGAAGAGAGAAGADGRQAVAALETSVMRRVGALDQDLQVGMMGVAGACGAL